jgi:glucokinase
MAPVLAVDIGGTKIATALVDDHRVLRAVRTPTPRGPAEEVWTALAGAIHAVLAGDRVPAVGIGCAGPVHIEAGAVSPVNITAWREFPLRDRVAAAVPGVPVTVAADGLCMAVGEHRAGAGRGARNMLGMVVSTGVGGGLVLAGQPYGGSTGNAGYVGHQATEPAELPCLCGGYGCTETVACGPAIARWAAENGWRPGEQADARILAADARAGNPVARKAFERSGQAVARAITGATALCDLDRVVIGGGVASAGPLLFDPIRATLAEHRGLPDVTGLEVRPAALGGDAGLVGAAALAAESLVAHKIRGNF